MRTDSFTLHYILHAATLVEERLRLHMDRLGLRHRQARIIDALSRMEPSSQADLAREFDLSPAAMSTMTARLIEAGYVAREVDPDEARSYRLSLTDEGRALLGQIYQAWRDIDALIAEQLGPDDTETFGYLARTLRDKLGGHVPGTPRKTTLQPPETIA